MNGTSVSQQSKLKRSADASFQKTERLIINIQSDDESVITNYHLDWLEFGIWCDFSAVEYLLKEIKKSLFSVSFKESYGNSRYYQALRADDYGITIFHDLRPRLKNCAMHILLAGTFFRYGFAFQFVNELLRFLHALDLRISPSRVDSAVDFVSMGERFIPVPHCLPLPGDPKNQKRLKYERVDDMTLLSIKTHPYKGDSLLRVYDKLQDTKDPHFLLRHPEYSGCKAVWRLEFEFRADTLRAVYFNCPDSWRDYDSVFRSVLGQCFRRYKFDGFEFPASTITSYFKHQHDDERAYLDSINKMTSHYRRAIQLEKRLYSKSPSRSFDEYSVFDLMSEGENND
ncbi:MAG: hypothetical protein ACD_39C00758G0005 [uncultured bacterium]|nr:MAG: hypothetical protein ACD_39C00758G0005 [uncultured bacterium]